MKKIALGLILVAIALASCSKNPAKYVENGKKYFSQKKYREAALEFRNAIKINHFF